MDALRKTDIDKAIVTVVKKHTHQGDVDIILYGINNLSDLEQRILGYVSVCDISDNALLEKIFHLIQIWGGNSGRYFYLKKQNKFQQNQFSTYAKEYKVLVDACLKLQGPIPCPNDCKNLAAFVRKNAKIPNLGVSFISKHIRFWTFRNLKQNALPIYDSIMAKNYCNKTKTPNFKDLGQYYEKMINDPCRIKLGLGLMDYERMLFNYYTRP